ncbi:MAG: hypothetical protein DRH50_09115 [Deltaproteobacteria bacterium]|nr:MAG: hypothetical protein DRH50_09115 [Deltaproteobacteria bacterium]
MTTSTLNQEGRSLQRLRMQFAYNELKEKSGGKDIKARLKGLPVALRMNGLAVVGAQLCASSEYKDRAIGEMLAEWLLKECPINLFTKKGGPSRDRPLKRLLEACISAKRTEYEAAQMEALAFLEQAKLIAEALWSED